MKSYQELASYQRCIRSIDENWRGFSERLNDRLRRGGEAEPVAEAIIEDLCTRVLDWRVGDLQRQEGGSDIILSRNGVKYLLIEAKRPKTLRLERRPLERAVDQARGYAAKQQVGRIAATDGHLFYGADLRGGGLADRIRIDLSDSAPPHDLWWISVDGIHRKREPPLPALPVGSIENEVGAEGVLHPRYKLPARCFGYVGDEANPRTWKYPYRRLNGEVDEKRLPAAIRAATSNYRGVRSDLPDAAAPFVIDRFVDAAIEIGCYDSPLKSYADLRAAAAQHKIYVDRTGERHFQEVRGHGTLPANHPIGDQGERAHEGPAAEAERRKEQQPEPGVATLASPQPDPVARADEPAGFFQRLRRALGRRRRVAS